MVQKKGENRRFFACYQTYPCYHHHMNQNLVRALKRVADTAGCRFASITYKSKETGEIARHTLLLGVNVERAYKRDLSVYKGKSARLQGVESVACGELIVSLEESLTVGIGNNSAYTCKDVYTPVAPGIKTHNETGAVYVNGFSLGKKVLQPGVYKAVKSSDKTLAKNALRKIGKMGRFRQFVIDPANVRQVRVMGRTFAIKSA